MFMRLITHLTALLFQKKLMPFDLESLLSTPIFRSKILNSVVQKLSEVYNVLVRKKF